MYLCGHKCPPKRYLARCLVPGHGSKKISQLDFLKQKTKKLMAKKSEAEKASAIIKFRIKGKEKELLQAEAKGKGISLTELLKARLYGRPAGDRVYDKNLFASIDKLTREMNSIGNNINQSTIAIHQIKNSQKIEARDFKQFNSLLQQYIGTRDQLRELLSKTLQWD